MGFFSKLLGKGNGRGNGNGQGEGNGNGQGKGPDFSALDSREKAEAAVREGKLEPLLLLPATFGGENVPQNVVYVPVGLAAAKASIDRGVIAAAVKAGNVRQYAASPEYQGKSFIPIRILIRAWDPGDLNVKLNIWGDALND
jgi:hypothetical protein